MRICERRDKETIQSLKISLYIASIHTYVYKRAWFVRIAGNRECFCERLEDKSQPLAPMYKTSSARPATLKLALARLLFQELHHLLFLPHFFFLSLSRANISRPDNKKRHCRSYRAHLAQSRGTIVNRRNIVSHRKRTREVNKRRGRDGGRFVLSGND